MLNFRTGSSQDTSASPKRILARHKATGAGWAFIILDLADGTYLAYAYTVPGAETVHSLGPHLDFDSARTACVKFNGEKARAEP